MSQSNNFFDGSPQLIFFSGFVSGIAIAAVLGLVFSFSGTGITLSKNTNNAPSPAAVAADNGSVPTAPAPSNVRAVSKDDHIRGNADAAVVMIEYSDFECPYCGRHHPSLQQAMDDYGDDVVWVYRHFPLSFHPDAIPAALASECAAEQGNFWDYADGLFTNQDSLGDDLYTSLAQDLGLNINQFQDCYDSQKYLERVQSDLAEGATAGVSGTPATFINGQKVSGAVPYAQLQAIIDAELN